MAWVLAWFLDWALVLGTLTYQYSLAFDWTETCYCNTYPYLVCTSVDILIYFCLYSYTGENTEHFTDSTFMEVVMLKISRKLKDKLSSEMVFNNEENGLQIRRHGKN